MMNASWRSRSSRSTPYANNPPVSTNPLLSTIIGSEYFCAVRAAYRPGRLSAGLGVTRLSRNSSSSIAEHLSTLANHFVGTQQQGLRNREPKCVGGLQIYYQRKLRCSLDRNRGRIASLEDFVHEQGRASPELRIVHAIDQQSATLRVFARSG